MNVKQFKPIFYPLRYRIRSIQKHGRDQWNSFKFNDRLPNRVSCMHRIASKLHYLGSHSYVQGKWWKRERQFFKRHPNF